MVAGRVAVCTVLKASVGLPPPGASVRMPESTARALEKLGLILVNRIFGSIGPQEVK